MRLNLTNTPQLKKFMHDKLDELMQGAGETAFAIGQEIIRQAREEANYKNWTNNLRSSYGVAIALNGKILKHDFELRGDGKLDDGRLGLQKAQDLVDELAKTRPNTLVLIMVAASLYSGFVEAKDGYSVLSAQANEAEKELKRYFKK